MVLELLLADLPPEQFEATASLLAGVVGVPVGVFHDDPEAAPSLVRFAFCKQDAVLGEAVDRLAALGARLAG